MMWGPSIVFFSCGFDAAIVVSNYLCSSVGVDRVACEMMTSGGAALNGSFAEVCVDFVLMWSCRSVVPWVGGCNVVSILFSVINWATLS
jgi:hypothetical protein